MSIFDDIKIEVEPIIEEAKEIATDLIEKFKDLPISITQKAVALVKETTLGTKIANIVSLLSGRDDLTGAEKFNAIFEAAIDAYKAFVDNGGLSGLVATGLNILRQLIQSIYDDFKAAFAA